VYAGDIDSVATTKELVSESRHGRAPRKGGGKLSSQGRHSLGSDDLVYSPEDRRVCREKPTRPLPREAAVGLLAHQR
jgi:hypothetical protein